MKKALKKLRLNRDTVRSLTPSALVDVAGGGSAGGGCNTGVTLCAGTCGCTVTCNINCFPTHAQDCTAVC